MTFDDFVIQNVDELSRYAGVLTGDRQLAHDVLIDSFVQARKQWGRIAESQFPLAYVRQILTRTYLADKRKQVRRRTDPFASPEGGSAGTSNPYDRVVDRDQVSRMLAPLNRRQRAVLVLRYYLDLPDSTIAAQLGMTEVNVRAVASRMLIQLRENNQQTDVKGDSR